MARLYSHQDRILVLVINPSDEPAEIAIKVDPADLHVARRPEQLSVYNLDGTELEKVSCPPGPVRYVTTLEPDGLRILEIAPSH